ncbi:MAG: JAB domain-containing protein [Chloroflexi bacterium]|nr:JAB domain-containing protein [Chloroflexota bacterium]
MVQELTLSQNEVLPRIRDLPNGDCPRERLLQFGPGVLSNAELLAILLRTGVEGENVLAVAQRLLSRFGGLRGIATASYGEMSGERGISEAKYCQVAAAMELGRRLASLSGEDRPFITSPKDVAALLMAEMALLSQEQLKTVLLSTKRQLIGVRDIYVGTVNTSLVRTAEVFRPAIRENAPGIVIVHNHPSGDPTPSQQDIDLTRQLAEAGRLLNIELMDHIIIGHTTWVSMKEKGVGF